jgi:hypothetical protein
MSVRQRKRRQGRRQHHSNTPSGRKVVAATGLTAGVTLAISGVAQAAPMTFTVGSLGDGTGALDCANPANTTCTLRQAIIDANANAGADTIVFKSGLTGSITMTADPEQVTEALDVQGPGPSQITVDGDINYRVFDVNPTTVSAPVSISGLTLSDGYTGGDGGAIFNQDADLTISNAVIRDSTAYGSYAGGGVYSHSGPVTINSSTISGNYVGSPGLTGVGGGIYQYEGELTVTNSTVTGNTAANYNVGYIGAYGGGIYTQNANLTVDRSTVNENYARDGGGLYSSSGDITVTNSTITGNNAVSDDGGGLRISGGVLKVVGSTVTDNYAYTAGGGLQSYNSGSVQNTIVSGNTAVGEPDTADLGYVDELFDVAFSLIGVPANHINETVPGSNLFSVNPQLGALANNGGPTQTQLPANSSPVVNKGSAFGLTTDQRGLTRPVAFPGVPNSTAAGADGSDIGAVEVQLTPTVTPTSPAPPAPQKKKKKCKKKKHKRSAESAKKKKCKKKKKK